MRLEVKNAVLFNTSHRLIHMPEIRPNRPNDNNSQSLSHVNSPYYHQSNDSSITRSNRNNPKNTHVRRRHETHFAFTNRVNACGPKLNYQCPIDDCVPNMLINVPPKFVPVYAAFIVKKYWNVTHHHRPFALMLGNGPRFHSRSS